MGLVVNDDWGKFWYNVCQRQNFRAIASSLGHFLAAGFWQATVWSPNARRHNLDARLPEQGLLT